MARTFILAVVFTGLLASQARAQGITTESIDRAAAEAAMAQPAYGRIPGRHCCSRKGAIVGAVVGAAVGVSIGWAACIDSRNCVASYAAVTGLMTGIGAGIGFLAGSPAVRQPIGLPIATLRF